MKTLRVLHLEDHFPDVELVQKQLIQGGIPCEITQVLNQDDFRLALLKDKFDLILSDYAPAAFDGVCALELARSLRPEIPFIFVSASLGEELAIEMLKRGARDYILKHRLMRLVPCVYRALHEAEERTQRQQAEAALRHAHAEVVERTAQLEAANRLKDELLLREQMARADAEAASRLKDEFLATLSHELRTPLNAMLGWSQLLRTRKFDPHTTARALETIERNTRSLSRLIEDLLDVSRIITGKLRLQFVPVELAKTITTVVDSLRPTAETKNITLHLFLSPHVNLVSGDSSRLQQVLWNLLSNAIKFTPEGGSVTIRLTQVQEHVQIQVQDTGIGIKANFLPYVFERFRQADSTSTRLHNGLGLGLAIVRHLIELHGGTVRAESPGENQGSTFTVELPVRTKTPSVEQIPLLDNLSPEFPLSPPSGTVQPILQGLQILVVDDEADAREFFKIILEQAGAKVIAVDSVQAACLQLQSTHPHLLLSDIGMPGEDGYSLVQHLRSLDSSKASIPAIAVTAYAREADRQQALAAGFQYHLSKPVDPAVLMQVVSNFCGRSTFPLLSNPCA